MHVLRKNAASSLRLAALALRDQSRNRFRELAYV